MNQLHQAIPFRRSLRLNPNQDTLAHVLKGAGYRTDHIGKWHIWAHKAGGHAGAENNYVPPGPYRLGFDDFWAAYNFGHDNFNYSYWTDSPREIRAAEFKPVHFTNLAIKRIEEHAATGDPFAMVVGYSPPHDPRGPNNVPKEWLEKFKDVEFPLPETWQDEPDRYMDRNTNKQAWLKKWKQQLPEMIRVYYAQTAALDEQVGRLLAALKETGLEKDTIVIFVSDHGEMFGAQGRVFKMTFYEESARVPFIIRWPGHIPAAAVSDACMATPDIMPTLLGLCGQKSPAAVEGMDLSEVTQGRPGPQPEFALLQGMGHTYLWNDGFEWRALRNKPNAKPARPFPMSCGVGGWRCCMPMPATPMRSGLYRFADVSDVPVTIAVAGNEVPLVLNDGYAKVEKAWKAGDVIELNLPMPARRVVADSRVKANLDRVALQRGPLVY
jgi:arylsulfatase A-like enzyme